MTLSQKTKDETLPIFSSTVAGLVGFGNTIDCAEMRIGNWLHEWGNQISEDWGTQNSEERQRGMKAVNPKSKQPPRQ